MISKLNINLKKNSFIMGDKGYIVKKKIYYRKKIKIEIVTNKRKNQLIQNNDKETQLLKKRYLVENCFALLKNTFKRIRHITDRKIENYKTFFIMALTCQIIQFLEKSQNK